MPMDVDVVVPVFNRWELTRSCLLHLRRQTLEHTAILADNGSTDGTAERLRMEFPEVRVVDLGANLGFPRACNAAAAVGNGDVVVLLNNDVECPPDFLARLVAPLRARPKAGSVASLLVEPNGELIESFGLAVDPTLAGYPRLRGEPREAAQTQSPVLI